MAREYPRHMYHRTLPPKYVLNRDEQNQLGPEWYQDYIRQEYPRVIYHRDGATPVVNSEAEEQALMAQNTKGESDVYSRTPFPVKPKSADGSRVSGAGGSGIDADTFQKIQLLEFEVETLKEQVQNLNGAVAELQRGLAGAAQAGATHRQKATA